MPSEREDEEMVAALIDAAGDAATALAYDADTVAMEAAVQKATDALVKRLADLRAALAAATARAEAFQKALHTEREGHAKAEALWLEAAKVQRERADAAQAEAERERVVRWCWENPRRLNLTGSPTNWPNETVDEYAARALAAAKGGQDA